MSYSGLACFAFFLISTAASYIKHPVSLPKIKIALPWWAISLFAALIISLSTEGVSLAGAGFLVAFGLLCHFYFKTDPPKLFKTISLVLIILLPLLAGIGVIPVFHSKLILSQNFIVEDKAWLFNFGKYAMGVILFSFITSKIIDAKDLKLTFIQTLKFSVLTIPAVLALAIALGAVQNISFTMPLIVFFVINTFTTCVLEESFFRGILQHKLCQVINAHIGIILISAFFALVHYPAGLKFVLCAFVASLGYGYVYYKTDRLESAVLLHALLNLSTMVLFDYPIRFE